MQATTIQAVSAAPRALDWLASTAKPWLLGSFPRALNLANEFGEVCSLVAQPVGNAPFALVLGLPELPVIGPATPLLASAAYLQIGKLSVWVTEARLWQPRPDWNEINVADPISSAQLLRQILSQHAPEDSLARLLVAPAGASEPGPFQRAAAEGLITLESGLQAGNKEQVKIGAKQLAGLGVGLTPAGDDFLMGLMLGLWASWDGDTALQWCTLIRDTAVPRTHLLSAAWLNAAAAGEAAQDWHALFMAMRNKKYEEIASAALRILPTGHTSGADALAGLLFALEHKDLPR